MDLGKYTHTHTQAVSSKSVIGCISGAPTYKPSCCSSHHTCTSVIMGPDSTHTYNHSRDQTLLSVHVFVGIHSLYPLSPAWGDLTLRSHKPWGLSSGLHECTIWCVCVWVRGRVCVCTFLCVFCVWMNEWKAQGLQSQALLYVWIACKTGLFPHINPGWPLFMLSFSHLLPIFFSLSLLLHFLIWYLNLWLFGSGQPFFFFHLFPSLASKMCSLFFSFSFWFPIAVH